MSDDDRRKNLIRLMLVRLDQWLTMNRPSDGNDDDGDYSDDDGDDDTVSPCSVQAKLDIIHSIPIEWDDVRQDYYDILNKHASFYSTIYLF